MFVWGISLRGGPTRGSDDREQQTQSGANSDRETRATDKVYHDVGPKPSGGGSRYGTSFQSSVLRTSTPVSPPALGKSPTARARGPTHFVKTVLPHQLIAIVPFLGSWSTRKMKMVQSTVPVSMPADVIKLNLLHHRRRFLFRKHSVRKPKSQLGRLEEGARGEDARKMEPTIIQLA